MNLIQKKCPNCGAPLSFEEKAEETVCEYCKQKISIKRNKNSSYNEEYILRVEEFYKTRYKQNTKTKIFIILMQIGCILLIIKMFNSGNNAPTKDVPTVPEQEKLYVTEISQLDESTLNSCHSRSLVILKEKEDSTSQPKWKQAGIYLLDHKESKQFNLFYDVYKKEYKSASGTVTLYAVVEFNNLELSENGTLDNYHVGHVYYPCNWIKGERVCGYSSDEDFFNEVIRNQTNKYKVTSTEGIYLEKIGN